MDDWQSGDRVLSSLVSLLEQVTQMPQDDITISTQMYEKWRENFLFETLQYSTRYGQSFCNKFDITDYILYYMRSIEQADKHIRKHYVR